MNLVVRISRVLEELVYRLVATRRGFRGAVGDARWATHKAQQEIEKGHWSDAIIGGRLAVASDPSYPDGYLMLGFAYARSGQPEEARKAYEEGARVAPHDARLASYLGELEFALHRWSEAEASLRRAVELDPAQAPWRLSLAIALRMQDRFEEATALLDGLLQVPTLKARALGALGEIRLDTGDVAGAEELLTAAVTTDPALAIAHHDLARLLALTGRWNEALREARQAMSLKPEDEEFAALLRHIEERLAESDGPG